MKHLLPIVALEGSHGAIFDRQILAPPHAVFAGVDKVSGGSVG